MTTLVSQSVEISTSNGFTQEFVEFMAQTRHPEPRVRKQVLKEMCPCRVKADIDLFWSRIIEMTSDESGMVRDQALHALGDGSPKHMEEVVMQIAESLYNDPEESVRKKARRMTNSYRRTGKWNVL